MSAEPAIANGSSELTAAQKLMQKHGAEDHKPTVEEVVDEEDIAHPPPSMLSSTHASTPASAPESTPAPLSEKAAGKQPAEDTPAPTATKPKPAALNVNSQDAFPSLGAARPAQAAAASMWGKKPAAVAKSNGVNGSANGTPAAFSNASSRAATPNSGFVTPSSAAPSAGVQLPGRYSERYFMKADELLKNHELKKPRKAIINDLNKRIKAKVTMIEAASGLTLEATGSGPEPVRSALKAAAKELGAKQSIKVPVPVSVRAHIIGRQGSTIKQLSEKSGARIQVPRPEENEAVDEDDEDATIDVLVEGDTVSANYARRLIEDIVGQRTSTVNTRLRDIPAEFYPFLAGPHNAGVGALEQGRDINVQIPHYHTWSAQPPPQANAPRQLPAFVPQTAFPINIAGDRAAAAEARAQIEQQVAQLKQQLAAEQLAIERGRHEFIRGEKGAALHDFLAETGCSVIFPPDSEDDEMILVVGPEDKLEEGVNKIMDLASSMSSHTVDFARSHPNAPGGAQAHAHAVTRYLQQRQAIQQLERTYDARIVPQGTAWQVYTRDGKNGIRARSDISNLVLGHPPSRLSPMHVDPFYHQHIRQNAGKKVREQFGVHLVVPEEYGDDDDILLVYEGPSDAADYELPRRQPSAQELQEFQRALKQAQEHLLSLIGAQQDIVSREVEAPVKFHDKIRRHVDRQQASLPNGQIPLQVLLGGPRGQPARKPTAPSVSVRGPTDRADDFVNELLAFIEQEKKDELERGFTLSFDFPQKFANQLIGRKGENIKKLREEFDVDIQVNDGKVELKGPEAKANACKSHILAMGKKLEDEKTYVLKVKPQYHRDLIGAKGSGVNRLQDRYNVRIQFPRSGNADDDDVSVAEGQTGRRSNQAADEVVVRGPSRGADQARDELLSLLQYVVDNSNEATVSVAQSQLPSLIGSGGRELDALRLKTGAQIDVPGARDAPSPSGRAEIKIKGSKKAVEEAKKEIEAAAKTFDSIVSRTLDVDRKHHRTIIGGGGANIRDLVVKAGGPDDRQKLARMVRFPRAETEGNTIRVEATEDVANNIVAAIEKLVSDLESQTTEIVEIAPEKHSKLIGRGGDVRKKIESDFSVSLDIPRQSVTGPERSKVKISGLPGNVEKAKEHVLSLTKDQEGATVNVPIKYHHVIADNGQFFRRLRSDHKVTVDHAGQKPPPKPEQLSARKASSSMPLITDDATGGASDENVSWTLHDLFADALSGEIPWVLSGADADSVEKARARLEKALAEAEKTNATGYLILPDPKSYRLVVGPGGSEINRIRKQTGTKIQVPKQGEAQEAIEITGSKDGVLEAKDIILGIVGADGK
ncbi:hypothetical protein AAFC00_004321 [Neodothiora populina]|uniref:K Homology domain-containing protein n=1 Tax=Neodothiora populina TaxID=2781224 RepID=A0ABR3PJK6_9PEZI